MKTMKESPAKMFGETLLRHVFFHGGIIESQSDTAHALGFTEFQMQMALNWCLDNGLLEELPDAGKGVQQ